MLHPTDLALITKLPRCRGPQLLRQAGFKVDLQSMDWQHHGVAPATKRDPPAKGGWNAFLHRLRFRKRHHGLRVSNASDERLLRQGDGSAGAATRRAGEAARSYVRAPDRPGPQSDRRTGSGPRAMQIGTHVPLGEYVVQPAARKNIGGVFGPGYLLPLGIWRSTDPRACCDFSSPGVCSPPSRSC